MANENKRCTICELAKKDDDALANGFALDCCEFFNFYERPVIQTFMKNVDIVHD